jgi:hypothetical protein
LRRESSRSAPLRGSGPSPKAVSSLLVEVVSGGELVKTYVRAQGLQAHRLVRLLTREGRPPGAHPSLCRR